MAKIRVEIAQLSSEITTRDDIAAQLVEEYMKAYNIWNENDTYAQKLNKFLRHLANHIVDVSNSTTIEKGMQERRAELESERSAFNWN